MVAIGEDIGEIKILLLWAVCASFDTFEKDPPIVNSIDI